MHLVQQAAKNYLSLRDCAIPKREALQKETSFTPSWMKTFLQHVFLLVQLGAEIPGIGAMLPY